MKVETLTSIKVSKDETYKDLLKKCYEHASKSNHPSTHNAALLVEDAKIILQGLNILPLGVKEIKERFEEKEKHIYLNHAERDLIYKAAKQGIKTNNLTMVMPWIPCLHCANAIISSGIRKLIVHKQMVERTKEGWQDELKNALEILKEAGVEVVGYDGIIGVKAYMHTQESDA